jgi:mono/diheme cytochrome c family protein
MRRGAHRMAALAALLSAVGTTAARTQTTEAFGKIGRASAVKEPYMRYCAGCHGPAGDGEGENAAWVDPKPRDFTAAVFKCRSTPSGTLPTDEDLVSTVRRGIVNSNMPPWVPLPEQTAVDLVAYIKTFSPRWRTEKPGMPIAIPPEPPVTTEDILQGRALYQKLECWKCHGPEGRGNGPSASTLTDSKDNPIHAFNFAAGTRFKCGTTNRDLYKIFMTGLDGTPMASFSDNLKGNQPWDLVHFLRTLQPLHTPEAAVWKEYVASHGSELKPIGPEQPGQ